MSFLQETMWTIFVNWSTNTAMAVIPSESSKSVTRSVMIYCHFPSSKGIGCKRRTFFLWSDFINWQTRQNRTHCPMYPHIPFHPNVRLMWSIVRCTPMCPIIGTSWFSLMIFCPNDHQAIINSWFFSTRYRIPRGTLSISVVATPFE